MREIFLKHIPAKAIELPVGRDVTIAKPGRGGHSLLRECSPALLNRVSGLDESPGLDPCVNNPAEK
jgi:hypothetical protein